MLLEDEVADWHDDDGMKLAVLNPVGDVVVLGRK